MTIIKDEGTIIKLVISDHILLPDIQCGTSEMNFNNESITLKRGHLLMHFSESLSHACSEAVTSWFRQSITSYMYLYNTGPATQGKSYRYKYLVMLTNYTSKLIF